MLVKNQFFLPFPLLLIFFLWSVFIILEKPDLAWPGMASDPVQANPHPSMRNGCRCVIEPGVSVEEVLVVVGELVGFENILSASRRPW